jgi:hypothetical protein
MNVETQICNIQLERKNVVYLRYLALSYHLFFASFSIIYVSIKKLWPIFFPASESGSFVWAVVSVIYYKKKSSLACLLKNEIDIKLISFKYRISSQHDIVVKLLTLDIKQQSLTVIHTLTLFVYI